MDKLFLLDAYALIYRAYYAMIKNPRYNSKGVNTSAIMGFVNTLEEVLDKEAPTHIGVAFDPHGPTFRHDLFDKYKAQREETPEVIKESVPIIKRIIEAYNIPILEVPGFEADDVIGTLSKQADEIGIKTYMMSPDKDYCQLVTDNVSLFKPRYGDNDFVVMTPSMVKEHYRITETLQMIDLLALMGDTSDNIPGCPGIGPKTAQKLISEFKSVDNLLNNTGKLKGSLKERVETYSEQIKLSKLLATIVRNVPIKLDMNALKRKNPDESKITAIFEDLEFKNLTRRVLGKNNRPSTVIETPNNQGFHGNLFDFFPGQEEHTEKYSTLSDINTTVHKYYLIDNKEKREALVKKFMKFDSFSFDTETTGIDPLLSEIVGLSLSAAENKAYYVPFPSNAKQKAAIIEEFRLLFENSLSLKIGQNIKFDILVLGNYGISVNGPLFDTMVAHYLLQPEQRHNMDNLAEIYLNYKTVHIEELIGERGKNQKSMADLPPEEVFEYACEDADITLRLKTVFQQELALKGLENLFYEIEMPLVRVLAYMERNGVRIDSDALHETSKQFHTRLRNIETDLYKLTGFEFNLSSPKQVGEALFDRLKIVEKPKKTKTGAYATSESVLESLRGKSPVVEKIMQHRGLKKLLSTYVDALPTLISPVTGKIHTSYNQTVTSTGRLSSSNPNLQNIPIRDQDGKEVRKAFIPDPDSLLFSADYSQIELRIMAHMSNDINMIEDFIKGEDIHTATASKIFHKPVSEVTKEERGKAKTANFGIIYGISVFGLAERLNVSRTEAKELIENYFHSYPAIKTYMEKVVEEAQKKGYVETILLRRRYLPDINSRNSVVRGYAERNAINAPIQGSAADIVKKAMIGIYKRFIDNNVKSTMILQVHDELVFNVVKGEEKIVEKIVIEEMSGACSLRVPLVADSGWGKNWLDAH